MSHPLRRGPRPTPVAPAPLSAEASPDYAPAVDAHSLRLIARIQRNHHDHDAVIALQTHYQAHRDFPSLANLMEGWARNLRDDRRAADAFCTAGEAVLAGAGDGERAHSLFLAALHRYPEHVQALDRLEALLREQNDDKSLERCLLYVSTELARRNSDARLRANVLYRLGRHYEQRFHQPGRAIAQYRAALELDAGFMPAIVAALDIYMASGKTAAVADMYELQIAATADDEERHALLMALAKYRRERLGDLDGAVVAVRRALKVVANDASTLELLANLLRERAEHGRDIAAADADRVRAAELFYQVARTVRRSHARPRLQACLALQPDHPHASRLLAELNAYGAQPDAQPDQGDASQAELERHPTGRYAPVQDPQSDAFTRPTLEMMTPEPELGAEEADLGEWLEDVEDDEVTQVAPRPQPDRKQKPTDRRPPQDASADDRSYPG